jgi:hypothetical protein
MMRNFTSLILLILFLNYNCKQKPGNKLTFDADARSQIIYSEEINKKIIENKNIQYKDATIIGDINFLNSEDKNLISPQLVQHHIHSSVLFYNCTFKGKIIAEKNENLHNEIAHFNKNLSFINCTFQDSLNFKSADFDGLVSFSESEFQENVSFQSAAFNYKKNYFNKSHFIKPVEFNLIIVNGDINFFETRFDDYCIFQLSKFNNPVQFASAKFNEKTNFSSVKFTDDVFFNYAEFRKSLNFNQTIFNERAEFIKTVFFDDSKFEQCIFKGKTLFNEASAKKLLSFENSMFYLSDPSKFNIIFDDKTKFNNKNINLLLK